MPSCYNFYSCCFHIFILNTPDIDTQDEEKLELFPFLFFLSVSSFLFLRDYYKFVSSYPFCRQAFLLFPLWTSIFCSAQMWGEFHFVSYMSPSRFHLLHSPLFHLILLFPYPIRGMKWKFDIIFQLLHLLMVSLSYDILLFFSFTLSYFLLCVLIFSFAYFSSSLISITYFILG